MPRHTALTPSRIQVLAAVYLPALLLAVSEGMLVPTLPLFASSLHVSFGVVGLVLAAESLGTLVADVPAGALLDRFGDKPLMVFGLALVIVAVLLLVFTRSVLTVIALRLAAGVGLALFNLSRHAYLTRATAGGRRGRAISTFGGVGRAGSFLGPAVGGLIAAAFGLRAPFAVYSAVSLAALVVVVAAVPKAEPGAVAARAVRPRTATFGLAGFAALRRFAGVLSTAGVAQLMAQMLRAGRKVLLPLYASQVLGLPVGSVGFILSASAFADLSLFYPAGLLMDRRGRKFAIVPSFLVQAAGLALVPATQGFATLLGVGLLLGFGNGLSAGSMMTLGADLAPPEALGEFLGVWRLVGDAGSSGGPLLVGAVADVLDLGLAAVAVAAVGIAAAAVFAYRVPETLRKA
jgi:MFS family permease